MLVDFVVKIVVLGNKEIKDFGTFFSLIYKRETYILKKRKSICILQTQTEKVVL